MAGLGLYGVTSYTVTWRRAELAIRMALGAAPATVIRLVFARLSALVGAGVTVGAARGSRLPNTSAGSLWTRASWSSDASLAAITLAAVGGVAARCPRTAHSDAPAEVLRES